MARAKPSPAGPEPPRRRPRSARRWPTHPELAAPTTHTSPTGMYPYRVHHPGVAHLLPPNAAATAEYLSFALCLVFPMFSRFFAAPAPG